MGKEALAPSERESTIAELAAIPHEEWRISYKRNNPDAQDRFRIIEDHDVAEDRDWLKRNKNKAIKSTGRKYVRENAMRDPVTGKSRKVYEVDILPLSFEELNPSRQREGIASITIAVDEVAVAVREGRPRDRTFIEQTARAIHIAWLSRHRVRLEREIEQLRDKTDEQSKKTLAQIEEQLLPYEELSDSQKEYDRAPVNLAITHYQKRQLEGEKNIAIPQEQIAAE